MSILKLTKFINTKDVAAKNFYLERWKRGFCCDECGSIRAWKHGRLKNGLFKYQCQDCKHIFSDQSTTILRWNKINIQKIGIVNHLSSSNCYFCFNARNVEDGFYLGTNIDNAKDLMDCDCIGYDPSELLYECIGNSGNFNCNFCNACWHNGNLEHCEMVFNSRDCFGCVSRSHAEFEILNKKYDKAEYYKKVAEIKSELKWEGLYNQWLFEPTYPYEDTIAPLYY